MSALPSTDPAITPTTGSMPARIPLDDPFDLEPAEDVGIHIFAEESIEIYSQEAGCSNTFSSVACDCATTLSTIFCYGCGSPESGCGDGSC
jgi:hypothetical protein